MDCINRKNEDIELVICSSLMEIKKSPIKFLGKASFHRLRNFLSGYAYALHAQMNYNTFFFLDFVTTQHPRKKYNPVCL